MSFHTRPLYTTRVPEDHADVPLQPDDCAADPGWRCKCPTCGMTWSKQWHVESDVCDRCSGDKHGDRNSTIN